MDEIKTDIIAKKTIIKYICYLLGKNNVTAGVKKKLHDKNK